MQVQHVPSRSPRRPIRSLVEALERRTLLSTYTVTNLADSGAGSLRDAIQQANANHGPDTIHFAAGLSGTLTLASGTLSISDDLDLVGPAADVISVSGMNAATVFHVAGGAVTMSGITITNGYTNQPGQGPGGGIVNEGHLTLNACALTHNQGVEAAGIYNASTGVLDVTNCTFSGNSAADSGYAAIFGGIGTVHVTHTTFSGNTGGGIISTGFGTVTMIDSTIAGNTANVGIKDGDGYVTIVNTTISGIAGNGGAINNYCSVDLTLVNCTLTDNQIGVVDNEGYLTATNCTITGNSVGLEIDSFEGPEVRVSLQNSILSKNGNDIVNYGSLGNVGGSNNLIGTDGSGAFVNGQDGNLVGVTDPKLAPLGDYGGPTQTMPPLVWSAAVDAGSNALAVGPDGQPLVSDERGDYRIVNGKVDIGAVEFNSTPLLPGDANGDGKVNFSDLLSLAQNYGKSATTWGQGDFNDDGQVDFADLLTLSQHYGKSIAAGVLRRRPRAI